MLRLQTAAVLACVMLRPSHRVNAQETVMIGLVIPLAGWKAGRLLT